jgi:hypothetical protein
MVKCSSDNCGKLFEAPKMHVTKFVALLHQQGWVYRGSINGHIYYCDEHPPVEAEVTSRLAQAVARVEAKMMKEK